MRSCTSWSWVPCGRPVVLRSRAQNLCCRWKKSPTLWQPKTLAFMDVSNLHRTFAVSGPLAFECISWLFYHMMFALVKYNLGHADGERAEVCCKQTVWWRLSIYDCTAAVKYTHSLDGSQGRSMVGIWLSRQSFSNARLIRKKYSLFYSLLLGIPL